MALSSHIAFPDIDPSIALAWAMRQEVECRLDRPLTEKLIERANRECPEFLATLLRCLMAHIKSAFHLCRRDGPSLL